VLNTNRIQFDKEKDRQGQNENSTTESTQVKLKESYYKQWM